MKELTLEEIIELDEAKIAVSNDLKLRMLTVRPQKLILLEGPSGVGKTTFVRAIVKHYQNKYPDFEYFEIGTLDVTDHVSTTSKKIALLFDKLRKISKPVLFIDEADTIFASRLNAGHIKEERTSTIMIQLNNEIPNLYIIAATNRPKMIDRAVLERFSERIHCPYPTDEGLKKLLALHIPFIDDKMRNALHKLMIESGLRWSGRDMEILADKLITCRDIIRLDKENAKYNPDYELTVEDVANEYNLRVNSKKHLKDDYLVD